jgi:hypothetical protein
MVKHRVAPYRPSYVVPAEWRLEVVEAVADGAERGLVVGRVRSAAGLCNGALVTGHKPAPRGSSLGFPIGVVTKLPFLGGVTRYGLAETRAAPAFLPCNGPSVSGGP